VTSADADRRRPPSRGRIDKRQAILDAAFAVFARQGYDQAGTREVAAEAGVAKPTMYNHFTDKGDLFLQCVEAAADTVREDCLAVIDCLRDPGEDLATTLREAARDLLRICCDDRSTALRRLAYAQLARFPDLVDVVYRNTSVRITEALSDRVALLCLSGHLRPCDPHLAAEQFLAMLVGPTEARSRLGSRKVPEAEARNVADAAADTFLRAFKATAATEAAPRHTSDTR
jgi:TetR/AcrR family transcriptional repressor of mexJK operon